MFEPFEFKGVTIEPGDVVSIEYLGRFGADIVTTQASVVQLVDYVGIKETYDGATCISHGVLEIMCSSFDGPTPGARHFLREDELASIQVIEKADNAVPRLAERKVHRGDLGFVNLSQRPVRAVIRAALQGGYLMGDVLEDIIDWRYYVAPTGSRVVAHRRMWSI